MPTISMVCDVQKLIEIVRYMRDVVAFSFMESIVLSIVDVEMGDLRPPTPVVRAVAATSYVQKEPMFDHPSSTLHLRKKVFCEELRN